MFIKQVSACCRLSVSVMRVPAGVCCHALLTQCGGSPCAGQGNYGYANSVCDMLCMSRRAAGLPALAIAWGPVDHVGYVAEILKVPWPFLHTYYPPHTTRPLCHMLPTCIPCQAAHPTLAVEALDASAVAC